MSQVVHVRVPQACLESHVLPCRVIHRAHALPVALDVGLAGPDWLPAIAKYKPWSPSALRINQFSGGGIAEQDHVGLVLVLAYDVRLGHDQCTLELNIKSEKY